MEAAELFFPFQPETTAWTSFFARPALDIFFECGASQNAMTGIGQGAVGKRFLAREENYALAHVRIPGVDLFCSLNHLSHAFP
jgi:hypothetical protein